LADRGAQWHETQDNLKLTMARNVYGIHAPIRLLMERKLVSRVRVLELLRLFNADAPV
jgi:proteasome maturation protein